MPIIAVDAMGGDAAPEEVVKGVAQVSTETSIECVLIGDEQLIQAVLDTVPYNPAHIAIHHTPDWIAADESPKDAVRKKRHASILVATQLVAAGDAHAVVTAGNTGAAVLACAKHFPMIPGVHKAALASVYPRQVAQEQQDQLALLLDVGATTRCTAEDLLQFALMGHAYARGVSKVEQPRVALLNMGQEATKGGEVLTAAYRQLQRHPSLDFVGNVEGNDLTTGKADVIVCEGLLGNVVLKLLEGVAEMATHLAGRPNGTTGAGS